MLLGFGWCHLQSSSEALREARPRVVDDIDDAIRAADEEVFRAFRQWMSERNDTGLQWMLLEHHNNESGLLTYSVSKNHRSSVVWDMLEWIRIHGPGSYGLFYCHDEEDTIEKSDVFRVHRLLKGKLEELPDPFFGLIDGDLGPVHPFGAFQKERSPEYP